jgi:redox-sensitive bicupin YhaK (pirin superfamily)
MIQLWVNLPKKDKLTPAKYQALEASQMGKVTVDGGTVNIIAGDFNGTKGPATTFTEMNAFDNRLEKGGRLETEIPAGHNTAILVVNGSADINGQKVKEHDFVLFKNEGKQIEIAADEKSVMFLMSGVPIDEPIAQYGPFVMNTQGELQEAFEEFAAGKFGYLD